MAAVAKQRSTNELGCGIMDELMIKHKEILGNTLKRTNSSNYFSFLFYQKLIFIMYLRHSEDNRFGTLFDLSYIVLLHVAAFMRHTRTTMLGYNRKFHKSVSPILFLHIGAGLFEVSRYHTAAFLQPVENVKPDLFDLVACIVQATTSLSLAKTLLRGGRTTRPTYQSGAITRLALSLCAFARQNSGLHRQSVSLVHGFVYTRIAIFAANILGFDKLEAPSTIYAQGVFVGGLIAVSEGGMQGGIHIYVTGVALIMVLNRKVSAYLDR